VLALTGYDQAPPALLALLASGGVPLVGVANGAEALREPAHPLVFNLRAGWRDEAAAMVLHLDAAGITDVATLSLDDELGRAGREGLRAELARLAIKPVAQAVLAADADAAAVRNAVDRVCRERPQALVLMLDAALASGAVQQARRSGCAHAIYVANEAGTRLGVAGDGVVVPQVVPPRNTSVPPRQPSSRPVMPGSKATCTAGCCRKHWRAARGTPPAAASARRSRPAPWTWAATACSSRPAIAAARVMST
jgi:branched-chain amino acid transport system substrate-binding protein